MANHEFSAQRRTVLGKKVARLRRDGLIPGIVYGPVVAETVPVTVERRDFMKFYQAHGHSSLFDLRWEDGMESVFIREVQVDPARRDPLHIDFFAPNLRKPVRSMVQLVFHKPVITTEAILAEERSEIEVEALPARIPSQIDVDVSGLEHPGDSIRVTDLIMPEGVTAITDGDEIVAHMEAVYQIPEEEAETPAEASAAPAGAEANEDES